MNLLDNGWCHKSISLIFTEPIRAVKHKQNQASWLFLSIVSSSKNKTQVCVKSNKLMITLCFSEQYKYCTVYYLKIAVSVTIMCYLHLRAAGYKIATWQLVTPTKSRSSSGFNAFFCQIGSIETDLVFVKCFLRNISRNVASKSGLLIAKSAKRCCRYCTSFYL